MPKVSVMMPAYNVEKYIGEAIESILNQTFQDFELIIIDDGSTDNTYQIAKTYADQSSKIRLLQNDENRGLVYTRNRLLDEAQGEYLAALDSDDIALLDRLEKQVDFLDNNPDIDLLGGGLKFFGEKQVDEKFLFFLTEPDKIACKLLFHNMFTQTAIMYKSYVKEMKYHHDHPLSEDYELWVRISWRAKVANLKDVLALCRLHPRSISARRLEDMQESDRLIHLKQLRRLGIEPSQKELDIHYKIAHVVDSLNQSEFLLAINWLEKLKKENRIKELYPQAAFEEELRSRLTTLLPLAFKLGNRFTESLQSDFVKSILPRSTRIKYWLLAKATGDDSNLFIKKIYQAYKTFR